MIEGYIVVRKAKDIDDRHWVCLDYIDAIRIATDVVQYWKDLYASQDINVRHEMVSIKSVAIFNYREESRNLFSVIVKAQNINESGEYLAPLNEDDRNEE